LKRIKGEDFAKFLIRMIMIFGFPYNKDDKEKAMRETIVQLMHKVKEGNMSNGEA